MADKQYHVKSRTAEPGPYSWTELKEQARAGNLRPTDRISEDGGPWFEAGMVKGLQFSETERSEKPTSHAKQKRPQKKTSGNEKRRTNREAATGDRLDVTFAQAPSQCPKCRSSLPPNTPLCLNCGFHNLQRKRAEIQSAGAEEDSRPKEHSPDEFRKAYIDAVAKFFLAPAGLLTTVMGIIGLMNVPFTAAKDRSALLGVSGISLALGVPFLICGIIVWRKSGLKSTGVLRDTMLRTLRSSFHRCADCGTSLCLRVVPNTLLRMGRRQWQWKTLNVCLQCMAVPCMVRGCLDRATVALDHLYAPGSLFSTGDDIPALSNDLWLCGEHSRGMKLNHLLTVWGNRLAVVFAVVAAVAFVNRSMVAGIIGISVTVPVVVARFLADRWLANRQLKKKKQYRVVHSSQPQDTGFGP